MASWSRRYSLSKHDHAQAQKPDGSFSSRAPLGDALGSHDTCQVSSMIRTFPARRYLGFFMGSEEFPARRFRKGFGVQDAATHRVSLLSPPLRALEAPFRSLNHWNSVLEILYHNTFHGGLRNPTEEPSGIVSILFQGISPLNPSTPTSASSPPCCFVALRSPGKVSAQGSRPSKFRWSPAPQN